MTIFNRAKCAGGAIGISAAAMTMLPVATGAASVPAAPQGERRATLAKGFDGFDLKLVTANGVEIGYRVAGHGPAVVLIHGFPETGFAWRSVAKSLATTNRVIVPDYRGAGASSKPENGYDKATMARDIHDVVIAEGIKTANIVGHDIGMPIAYAYARQYPTETSTLTLLDGFIPGTAVYRAAIASGRVWHFGFSAEVELATTLLTGREDIYLDRMYDKYTVVKSAIGPDERAFYLACIRQPGALAAGLSPYQGFAADAEQNSKWLATQGKLKMPVLVAGGSGSLGPTAAMTAAEVAIDPHVAVIQGAGHFVAEEQPEILLRALREQFNRADSNIE